MHGIPRVHGSPWGRGWPVGGLLTSQGCCSVGCRHKTAEQKLAEWQSQAKERELEKVAIKHIKEQAKAAQREEMMEVSLCKPGCAV